MAHAWYRVVWAEVPWLLAAAVGLSIGNEGSSGCVPVPFTAGRRVKGLLPVPTGAPISAALQALTLVALPVEQAAPRDCSVPQVVFPTAYGEMAVSHMGLGEALASAHAREGPEPCQGRTRWQSGVS